MRILILATAAVLMAGAAAAPAFAQVTSLTGMWQIDDADAEGDQKLVMPLTPQAQAIHDAKFKAIEAGDVIGEGGKRCAPHGMPTMMVNEFALEFLETPGRITVLNESSTFPRTIYLDETAHTRGLEASYNGHSIGHWEGGGDRRTLVIDTVNFNDKGGLFGFIGVHSSTTHLIERFHTEDGGKRLVGEYTFEDPRYLKQPWTGVVHYNRLPPHSELWEYACETDGGWSERYKGDPAAKGLAGG